MRTFKSTLCTIAVFAGLSTTGVANPDLIVGDMLPPLHWGQVGDIHAYSIGLTTCNFGTSPAMWVANTPEHPVFTQNMYRLHERRFEQIGMSWASHGFFALQQQLCQVCTPAQQGQQLGVGCADVSTASILGQQAGMGPRSDINPSTGVFPFPPTDGGQSGDAIYKRIQVHAHDLDVPGASFYVSGQIVSADEASKGANSVSWRPVTIAQDYSLSYSGMTRPKQSALFAWAEAIPEVVLASVDVPGDGRFWVGVLVEDHGDGTWSYEYAVQNLNSHRAARAFSVPHGGGEVSAIGFHDVAYHSGEMYDGTDWTGVAGDEQVRWHTDTFAANQNANALRWGTLYNFRFTTTTPPTLGSSSIELFRPGAPDIVELMTLVPAAVLCPADFNGDGVLNFFDIQEFLAAFAARDPSADLNGDGIIDFFDVQVFLQRYSDGCD